MDEFFPFLFGFAFLVIGIVVLIYNHERNRSRIQKAVESKGFNVVNISRRWIDFGGCVEGPFTASVASDLRYA